MPYRFKNAFSFDLLWFFMCVCVCSDILIWSKLASHRFWWFHSLFFYLFSRLSASSFIKSFWKRLWSSKLFNIVCKKSQTSFFLFLFLLNVKRFRWQNIRIHYPPNAVRCKCFLLFFFLFALAFSAYKRANEILNFTVDRRNERTRNSLINNIEWKRIKESPHTRQK